MGSCLQKDILQTYRGGHSLGLTLYILLRRKLDKKIIQKCLYTKFLLQEEISFGMIHSFQMFGKILIGFVTPFGKNLVICFLDSNMNIGLLSTILNSNQL